MEVKSIKEALTKSNFILYALANKIDEDYKETLEDTIELNKTLLKELSLDAPVKKVEAVEQDKQEAPQVTLNNIRNDLMTLGLMDSEEVEDKKNNSLMVQLRSYKEINANLFYDVLTKVKAHLKHHKVGNLQAYLIGSMKKEYGKETKQ